MKIEIVKIAQQEFNESKQFYEIEQTGLGVRFENKIKMPYYVLKNSLLFGHLNEEKSDVIQYIDFLTKYCIQFRKIPLLFLYSPINIEDLIVGSIE